MTKKIRSINCPYCKSKAKLVSGDIIYPRRRDLKSLKFYFCEPCHAYVGTHKRASDRFYEPLGTLANEETRKARSEAHAVFDILWRNKHMKRSEAYQWLAEKLSIPVEKCHIGSSDVKTCALITELSKIKLASLKRKMIDKRLVKLWDHLKTSKNV